MTFAELLKEKDLHRAQVARRVGVNRSAVARWARGDVKPKIEQLPKIAEALNVTTDEVIACFTKAKEEE